MTKRPLPIGIDLFPEIIKKNYFYIDKTLMIKEFLDGGAKATLVLRPRRFGKTLNMSMFKCFFEKSIPGSVDFEESTKYLFDNLAVSQDQKCMAHQGKYPVIFITLKDIKGSNWDEVHKDIKKVISEEWRRHEYLAQSPKLKLFEHEEVSQMLLGKASNTEYKSSLKTLTKFLSDHHGVRPIVLIDEYDTPIYHGYANGYYDQIIDFMRSWLGSGLKSNENLEFGIITGILKVAKESIFSGLNNLKVCDSTQDFYADKFGFSHDDVVKIIEDYSVPVSINDAESWYNGYQFGLCKAYNPWSILQLVDHKGALASYWVRTGVDNIIKPLLQKASDDVKFELEQLMLGKTINVEKNENIVFPELSSTSSTIWNFILGCGYLTWEKQWLDEVNRNMMGLVIPNTEISTFFRQTVTAWMVDAGQTKLYTSVLDALTSGNLNKFAVEFKRLTLAVLSYFDITGQEPENFYHAFVVGMLVSLQTTHQIRSNRESGTGRYDVMLIPRDVSRVGVVLEFKKFDSSEDESLLDTAQKALVQIKEKKYATELHDVGIKNVVLVGMGFEKKEVEVVYEK